LANQEFGNYEKLKSVAHCLKHGTETVLSNGPIGKNVTLALANLNNPTTIAHYDFAFVKPWTKRITFCFKTFKTIITIEDGVTKGFWKCNLSLPPKQLYRKNTITGIDEFIEHGTVDELQEYCKIDVKSLEIVFLLSQNNYFALPKHNAPIMKLLSLFLLIFCIAIFRKHVLPKNYYYLDGPEKIEPDTLSHWIKKIKSDFSLKLYLLMECRWN
jgi:hypothetical protein